MEIIGKTIFVGELQQGTSQKGTWYRREFVIETQEQYPKKMAFQLTGDMARDLKKESILYKTTQVKFTISSTEYNTKWYTRLNAFNVMVIEG